MQIRFDNMWLNFPSKWAVIFLAIGHIGDNFQIVIFNLMFVFIKD